MTAKFYNLGYLAVALGRLFSGPAVADPAVAHPPFCGTEPAAGFDQPPNQSRRGRYINHVYGYSVVIPDALTGYVQAPGVERGFVIVLSWSPRSYLRVDAAYDALFDITVQGVHRDDLGVLRLHDTVISDQGSAAKLASESGSRFVTRLQCEGNAALFVHDEVIAMRHREIYRLYLQTVPERYATDVKRLNAMLRSWRWEAVRSLR